MELLASIIDAGLQLLGIVGIALVVGAAALGVWFAIGGHRYGRP